MDSGLKIIVTGRGSYYSLVRVCWLRARHGGYDLLSSRVIFGPGRDLADLAKNGLRKGWTIRTACDAEHDILGNAPFRVVLKADESAWAEHCPRPANWEAEP